MQCVGTLSWSLASWGAPRTRGAGAPARHQRDRGAAPDREAGSGAARMHLSNAIGMDATGIDAALLVQRCMNGEASAWTEMVRTHHRRVYALCYRFTGNAADAEDLTQDVFLKIYANLSSFDAARGSLPVWIATMTRNLLVDNFRRTRNQRATGSLDEGWDGSDELRPMDRLMSGAPSPHDAAVRRELEALVQKALAQVSPELREALILRDLQDLDYKEIAQVLDIPEGTVKSRISRGRAELARLLERTKREVM